MEAKKNCIADQLNGIGLDSNRGVELAFHYLKSFPGVSFIPEALGRHLLQSGQIQDAKHVVDWLYNIDPYEIGLAINKAKLEAADGNVELAIGVLDKILVRHHKIPSEYGVSDSILSQFGVLSYEQSIDLLKKTRARVISSIPEF